MTSHERCHELLALRLYDELDPDEAAALDAHLGRCASCRAFADDLARELGPAARAAPAPSDLPPGWREALDDAVDRSSRTRRLAPWLAPAASFAAGVLLTLALTASGPEPADPAGDTQPTAAEAQAFRRSTPPPPARGRGRLALLRNLDGR